MLNSTSMTGINYILKHIQMKALILNSKNISKCYCFLYIGSNKGRLGEQKRLTAQDLWTAGVYQVIALPLSRAGFCPSLMNN